MRWFSVFRQVTMASIRKGSETRFYTSSRLKKPWKDERLAEGRIWRNPFGWDWWEKSSACTSPLLRTRTTTTLTKVDRPFRTRRSNGDGFRPNHVEIRRTHVLKSPKLCIKDAIGWWDDFAKWFLNFFPWLDQVIFSSISSCLIHPLQNLEVTGDFLGGDDPSGMVFVPIMFKFGERMS